MANVAAFAALLGDGSVVAWGDPSAGGDCRDVQDKLVDVQDAKPLRDLFWFFGLIVRLLGLGLSV